MDGTKDMTEAARFSPEWIELPQKIAGWENFIGAWLIRGKPTIVVDVGPSASIDALITQLEQRAIKKVDYIWLTHIHIDHAGGLAPFLNKFPTARAVVPTKGIPHLIDPTKLWEGSLATLGEKALAYGPIDPVSPERLISPDVFSLDGLTILDTPGHAPFHLSFCNKDSLFCGESAGIFQSFGDRFYLRPPTPPRFFFEQTVASVNRMLALDDCPIFFGHSGASDSSSRKILGLYREQLFHWKSLIGEIIISTPDPVTEQVIDLLLEKDPFLACFQELNSSAQQRERFFIANSIAGFVGYLRTVI
jgi:glyoxylase-like metal-dependent hydrolase (beta-lactamase superfamily II)